MITSNGRLCCLCAYRTRTEGLIRSSRACSPVIVNYVLSFQQKSNQSPMKIQSKKERTPSRTPSTRRSTRSAPRSCNHKRICQGMSSQDITAICQRSSRNHKQLEICVRNLHPEERPDPAPRRRDLGRGDDNATDLDLLRHARCRSE